VTALRLEVLPHDSLPVTSLPSLRLTGDVTEGFKLI